MEEHGGGLRFQISQKNAPALRAEGLHIENTKACCCLRDIMKLIGKHVVCGTSLSFRVSPIFNLCVKAPLSRASLNSTDAFCMKKKRGTTGSRDKGLTDTASFPERRS